MSTIFKVIIALNLLLSAAFVGWAGNALGHAEDYKKQLADAKAASEKALAEKQKEVDDLTVEKNAVTDQQRQFREQRDGFQTEADRLKTQLEELKRSNDTMQGNLTKIQATLNDYNDSIKQLGEQKDAAIQRANEADRAKDAAERDKDTAVVAKKDAEDATRNAMTRIADLETDKKSLAEQVDNLNTRLDVIVKQTGVKASDIYSQKQIEGLVLDVKKDLKLVIINKGKKDEVKVGYVFDIYRGSQYKGQVRIQDVQETMASGIILNEMNPIGRGDSATTSL
jgi:DNA repair exonuclease SbcCD ATPase subunit